MRAAYSTSGKSLSIIGGDDVRRAGHSVGVDHPKTHPLVEVVGKRSRRDAAHVQPVLNDDKIASIGQDGGGLFFAFRCRPCCRV
jgi:hypothetical protein